MELFSLLDIVHDNVLGNIANFRTKFASVIQSGLKKNANRVLA
jgi:hypothetical protein